MAPSSSPSSSAPARNGTAMETAHSEEALIRVTDEIKASCERFRVLVLGREGVGKSTLINKIFKVDLANVEHYSAGSADINQEILSDENAFLVLHDSQGYGTGEMNNLKKLKTFIEQRTNNANVSDRLHAIWLCITTPYAGGRVLQSGDEEIFQFVSGNVPIIVVFTQYDQLVRTKERQISKTDQNASDQAIQSRAKVAAEKTFLNECVTPLSKASKGQAPYVYISVKPDYEDTLKVLVKRTLHHINPSEYQIPQDAAPPGTSSSTMFRNPFRSPRKPVNAQSISSTDLDAATSVSVMFATAQRVDIDANIKTSVGVGRKKYWRGLASGAHFMGKNLKRCLEVIHEDIVAVWNFPSIGNELMFGDFKAKVSKIVDELADLSITSPNDGIIQTTASVAGAVGATAAVIAGTANPAGFIVGPVIAAVVFAKWVYDVYSATPSVLRCFMAYIIDLIVIMQMIFAISEKRENGVVSPEEVEDVLKRFQAGPRSKIHTDVRKFVKETNTFKVFTGKDVVLDKIVELIDLHCYVPPRGEQGT